MRCQIGPDTDTDTDITTWSPEDDFTTTRNDGHLSPRDWSMVFVIRQALSMEQVTSMAVLKLA